MPTEKYLIKLCRFKLMFSELSLYPPSLCILQVLTVKWELCCYTGLSIKRHLAESMGQFSGQRLYATLMITERGNKCDFNSHGSVSTCWWGSCRGSWLHHFLICPPRGQGSFRHCTFVIVIERFAILQKNQNNNMSLTLAWHRPSIHFALGQLFWPCFFLPSFVRRYLSRSSVPFLCRARRKAH